MDSGHRGSFVLKHVVQGTVVSIAHFQDVDIHNLPRSIRFGLQEINDLSKGARVENDDVFFLLHLLGALVFDIKRMSSKTRKEWTIELLLQDMRAKVLPRTYIFVCRYFRKYIPDVTFCVHDFLLDSWEEQVYEREYSFYE